MKRAFVAAFALCAVLAFMGTASAASPVRANIPFTFHAGSTILPPGEYVFELGANLVVRSAASGESYFVPSYGHTSGKPGESAVTFLKYDNTYFLAKVQMNGEVISAPKTKLEKSIIARNSSKGVTVAQLGLK